VAPAWPLHHPLGDGFARDGADEAAKAAGAVGDIGRAGHGEGHVLGGEGAAVVPLHALTQLEFPDGGLDERQAVARPGTSCALAVRSVSVLKMCSASEKFGAALKKCGSSKVMEPPVAIVRQGPAGA